MNFQDKRHLEHYRKHRKHVLNAQCLLDHRRSFVPSKARNNLDGMINSARILLKRTHENVNLLLNLSSILRTEGKMNTHTGARIVDNTALPRMLVQVEQLQQRNLVLGKRLLTVRQHRSDDGLAKPCLMACRAKHGKCTIKSELPDETHVSLAKYKGLNLQLPLERAEQIRLLRPHVCLHFGTVDGRPLGMVVIQLYTEAAPLIVLEFMRKCAAGDAHDFLLRRIFPNLWLECYLQGSSSPLNAPLEYDNRVLNHAKHDYVLSSAKEYCQKGFPSAAINFSISCKRLTVSNGRRVGFGRVVRGGRNIKSMEWWGSRNGKTSVPILITNCCVL